MALLSRVNRANLLALALALVTLSANVAPGVTRVFRHNWEQAYTLDICHPLPGVDRAIAFPVVAAIIPAGSRISPTLASLRCPLSSGFRLLSRPAEKPDDPPPKMLV